MFCDKQVFFQFSKLRNPEEKVCFGEKVLQTMFYLHFFFFKKIEIIFQKENS